MENQHRRQLQPMPYTRNIGGYHSRRISSCSSGSGTSSNSNYASSEDNMFVHRHMDNNNIPKHIDNRYLNGSHENKAYHHEEMGRPFSTISSDGEVAEIERDSNHVRQVSQKLRGTFCSGCNDTGYRFGGSYCQNCSSINEHSPDGSLNQPDYYSTCRHHSSLDSSSHTELCGGQINSNTSSQHNRINFQVEIYQLLRPKI